MKFTFTIGRARMASLFGSFLLALATGCPPDGVGTGEQTDNTDGETSGSPIPTTSVPAEVSVDGSGDVERETVGEFETLTAVAEAGWRFDRWTGDVDSTDNPLTISNAESLSITAVFALEDSGESEPPAPLPGSSTDIDGDGVLNANDRCANTATDALVDDTGCSAAQRDSDRDDVSDADDACPGTPATAEVDENGCAATQRDTDQDGVVDARDECAGTATGVLVLASGCPPTIADSDGDGVPNGLDRCPQTPAGSTVNSTNGCRAGELPVCGNGVLETGEQCDPPNGTTCSAVCLSIGAAPANDLCGTPMTVQNGTLTFNNTTATTTGTVPVTTGCFAPEFQNDLWYCYTATCTGVLGVSSCPGTFDTMVAVYNGCACPTAAALVCNDDGCGALGAGSLALASVTSGQQYMIRVGGWQGDEGSGPLTIACTTPTGTCGNSVVEAGEQCDPPNGTTCSATCQTVTQQPLCGNGTIDAGEQCEPPNTATCNATCQSIAPATFCGNGIVEDNEECEPPGLGTCALDCRRINSASICGNGIVEGEEECEPPGLGMCGANCQIVIPGGCGPTSGNCCAVHANAGCSDEACCARICELDPVCCAVPPSINGTWDAQCVALAESECTACADGCITPCPLGGVEENEGNCGLPSDSVNGGCVFDVVNPRALPITCGGPTFCGTSTYSESFDFGDTDWFEINLTEDTDVTLTIAAEFAVTATFVHTFPVGVAQCDAFGGFTPLAAGEACETVTLRNCLRPGRYWVMVFSTLAESLRCGSRYTLDLTCSSCSAAPPANDGCAGAVRVPVGGSVLSETTRADQDPVPSCAGVINTSQGVWYKVIGNGRRLTASTCGLPTDFDTQLSVYCEDCAAPTCIGANDNACDFGSDVSWCSQLNAEYLVLVHGAFRQAGTFELNITSGAACSNAVDCGGISGDVCGPGRGDCRTVHNGPGCDNAVCCQGVCTIDPVCCMGNWDADCVIIANQTCAP